jgi:membrane dipeptidase
MLSAQALHREAVIVNGLDATPFDAGLVENMKKGGVDCNVVYAGVDLETTIARYRVLKSQSDSIVLATTAREIREAKQKGKIAIVFNWQHVNPIGNNEDLLTMYYGLGLRICGLSYNVRNLVGDGCTERTQCGLSLFGERVVRKIQELRMVLDIGGHTSEATSRDVLDMTRGVVVCTHTNCRALRDNPRCMTDDMMRAIARRGGVIGMTCYGYFLTEGRATLDTFLDHVDHAVRTAGVEHVGIGLDQIAYPAARVNPVELALPPFQDPLPAPRPRAYPVDSAQWYTEGLETIAQMPNVTAGLFRRGHSPANVRQIMGENWLRVYEETWGN